MPGTVLPEMLEGKIQMTPTTLEFTAADFFAGTYQDDDGTTNHYNLHPSQANGIAERANRILRDKLANAPEVYGNRDCPYSGDRLWTNFEHNTTHRARLVDITEIITVSERDAESITEAIENPPEPNEQLKKLFKEIK